MTETESKSKSIKNRDSLFEISEWAIHQAFAIHVSKGIRWGFDHMSSTTASEFQCPLS